MEAVLHGGDRRGRFSYQSQQWQLARFARQNDISGRSRRQMMRLARVMEEQKLHRGSSSRFLLFLAGLSSQDWVRKPEHLPMLSGGSEASQRRDIVQHLLLRWPVPESVLSWLAPTLYRNNPTLSSVLWSARIIAHLGRGAALRDAPFGAPLTRRMRKLFMLSPSRIGPVEAVRRAQILGAGGSHALLAAVMRTSLAQLQSGQLGDRESWWHQILCWLATRRDLPVARVADLIHWLVHVRASGEDYDPRGRPLASVLRRLAQSESAQALLSNVSSWEGEGLALDMRIRSKQGDWHVREIRTPEELLTTGRAMSNCAWSYKEEIVAGTAALFSVWQGRSRRALLEVALPQGHIRQVKARANLSPSEDVRVVVRHWAHRVGLSLTTMDV